MKMTPLNYFKQNAKKVDHCTSVQKRPSIWELLSQYRYIEKQCDKQIDDAQKKTDHIVNTAEVQTKSAGQLWSKTKISINGDDGNAEGTILCPDPVAQHKPNYIRRMKLARKFCDPQQVFGGDSLMSGASEDDLQTLEEADTVIQMYKYQLSELESQILEVLPRSKAEISAKLKFISCLFIEKSNLDVDVFAGIVREAAEQLEVTREVH